jgi:hypothetical protein
MIIVKDDPYKQNAYFLVFDCDEEADVDNLPTSTDKKGFTKLAAMGSTAFVIESSAYYMLDSNDVWVPQS